MGRPAFVEDRVKDYRVSGLQRAMELGNRGPMRFTDDGQLQPDITKSFRETGFYIFEGLLSSAEIEEIKADLDALLDRAPTHKGSEVDRFGRPALGVEHPCPGLLFAKPLSDPFGGTDVRNGRHSVQMAEPTPSGAAPRAVPYLVSAPLGGMESFLRVYGHPDILRAAASFNGDDFTPYTESIFIKGPDVGAAVAWHQDGTTHWDNPELRPGYHGVNFMVNLHRTTPANALWLVPGSNAMGKLDIGSMCEEGTDLIPGAVPMVLEPGDVAVTDRQIVHGSFPNNSPDPRVTLTLSYLPRASVLGVTNLSGDHFTEEWIHNRSKAIGYAIDARRQHDPDEEQYDYKPMADFTEKWDPSVSETYFGDYSKYDIYI